MIIEICSQTMALELAATAQTKTSVISITSKEDADLVFPDNPYILSVLHLKFNDLTEEYDEEGIPYGRPLPKQEDFTGLREFINALHCDRLIIHCYEGTSRSAAVAKAVYEYRGCKDEIHSHRGISPNPLVYSLACRELKS